MTDQSCIGFGQVSPDVVPTPMVNRYYQFTSDGSTANRSPGTPATIAGTSYAIDSSRNLAPFISGVPSFAGRSGAITPQAADYATYYDAAGAAAAAAAASQPLDTDLTAIALLSTTPFGRSLLTLASAAALTAALVLATPASSGSMPAASQATTENFRKAQVNILDYGGDNTGAASIAVAYASAAAALPSGGIIFCPPGAYNCAGLNLSTAHITLRGAARYNTAFITSATTGAQVTINQYYISIEDLTFTGPGSGQVATKTAGYAIDCNATNAAYGKVRRCTFTYQYDCINVGCTLMDVEDVEARYWAHSGINVTQNSDHRISLVTMDNNTGALPTGGGIVVQATASLILDKLNIIHANNALDIAPGTGVTVPSVKGTNCFFDTSAIGCRMASAGSWLRSEFTNCWFSSMSIAAVQMGPTTAGGVDGITWTTCDFYNNVGGTTTGFSITTANVGKWTCALSNIAGWTTAFALIAGSAHFPMIVGNRIGAISAFAANGTAFNIGAGAYKGLFITGNDALDNTAILTLGAVTTPNAANFRITDNGGINPRGTVTTPAVPTSTTVVTNTTGFRVTAYIKGGVTTVVTVNGVATPSVLAAGGNLPVQLDPGGTIAVTYSTAFTWVWVAN